jgi:hypothetical protein
MGCILHVSGLEGEKYLSSAPAPDLMQLFFNRITLRFSSVSIIISNIRSVLRNRQTDTRCDHFTFTRPPTHPPTHKHTHTHRSVRASLFYTPKCKLLFGRHCRRLRDRQIDMQNGVLHNPRKLLPLL